MAEERELALVAALAHLADIHHRTITGSRLHDPERIEDFTDCPCRTCRFVTETLAAYADSREMKLDFSQGLQAHVSYCLRPGPPEAPTFTPICTLPAGHEGPCNWDERVAIRNRLIAEAEEARTSRSHEASTKRSRP